MYCLLLELFFRNTHDITFEIWTSTMYANQSTIQSSCRPLIQTHRSAESIQSSSRPLIRKVTHPKRRRNSSTHTNEKSLLKDGCGSLYVIRGTLTVQAERGADLTLKDEGPGIRTRYSSSGGKALVYCNIFFSASGGAALFYNKRRKKRGKKLWRWSSSTERIIH